MLRMIKCATFPTNIVCINHDIFFIAGLFMLIGLVMYISIFKAEIGSKLRPKSQLQPPLFTYSYGFSFLLIVSGFMSTEMAGTCAIFLYIYWHQKDWSKKQERRKVSAGLDLRVPTPDIDAIVPCRRHRGRPRRYSFGSARYGGCSRETSPRPGTSRSKSHQQLPVSDSMRDISYYSFPQVASSGHETHSVTFSRDPTCNTVSTTADINCEYSREFVTFDIDHSSSGFGVAGAGVGISTGAGSGGALSSTGTRSEDRRKEMPYDTLRRTTPV